MPAYEKPPAWRVDTYYFHERKVKTMAKAKRIDNKEKTEAMKQEKSKELERFKMYTLTEIEPIIGVTHRTLLTYVKEGKLKAVKIGGKWKVSEKNLMAFLDGE